MKIGFIGLGTMGFPMASRLAEAGHSLAVFDTSPEAMAKAAGLKAATGAASPAEAAEHGEVIFTVLPNDEIVRGVFWGAQGIAEGVKKGH